MESYIHWQNRITNIVFYLSYAQGVDPLPPFDGDYYAMIQDWPKTDSFETSLMMHHGLK